MAKDLTNGQGLLASEGDVFRFAEPQSKVEPAANASPITQPNEPPTATAASTSTQKPGTVAKVTHVIARKAGQVVKVVRPTVKNAGRLVASALQPTAPKAPPAEEAEPIPAQTAPVAPPVQATATETRAPIEDAAPVTSMAAPVAEAVPASAEEDAIPPGTPEVVAGVESPIPPDMPQTLPRKELKTAAELAAMIEFDLAQLPEAPGQGLRVTVYGATHWRAMLTILPAAGPVRDPQQLRNITDLLADRLRQHYDLAWE